MRGCCMLTWFLRLYSLYICLLSLPIERIVDLSKAISGMEGKVLQGIAFKIYNAR